LSFNRPWIIIVLILFLVLALWRGRDDGENGIRRTRLLMGTLVEIEASGTDTKTLERAVAEAFDEMERVERVFSSNLPESEISLLNRSASLADYSSDVASVLTVGLDVAQRSGGAFDMTLGALKALWGIEGDTPRVPSPAAIDEALLGTGPKAIRIVENRIVKTSVGLRVDLGGIAKGYAADRGVEVLRKYGVTTASVNAGGDIALLGRKEERPWHIGIRNPRNFEGVVATVAVDGGSVVTSGDYERCFERDGVRYHHIFDPRTGYPASKSQSVTVIASTSVLADALATAVFVLGPSEGLALLETFPEAEGLVIAADGSRHISKGIKQRVVWQ